jgi:hypothetical protein
MGGFFAVMKFRIVRIRPDGNIVLPVSVTAETAYKYDRDAWMELYRQMEKVAIKQGEKYKQGRFDEI